MAAPESITNLSFSPKSGGGVLSWDDPNDDTITGLQWRYLAIGDTADLNTWVYVDIPDSAHGEDNHLSYEVSGLTNGITYAFDVRAVNEDGNSTGNSQVYGVPIPPPILIDNFRQQPGDASVVLTWDRPGSIYDVEKIQYRMSPALEGGEALEYIDIPDSGWNEANYGGYTVTGLTNDTRYCFSIRAVNAAGNGPDTLFLFSTPRGGAAGATGTNHPVVESVAKTTPGDDAGTTSVDFTADLPDHDEGDLLACYVYRTRLTSGGGGGTDISRPSESETDGWVFRGHWWRSAASPISQELWAKIGDGSETTASFTTSDGLEAMWMSFVARITNTGSDPSTAIELSSALNGKGDSADFHTYTIDASQSTILHSLIVDNSNATQTDIEASSQFPVAHLDAYDSYSGNDDVNGFVAALAVEEGPFDPGTVDLHTWEITTSEEYVTFTTEVRSMGASTHPIVADTVVTTDGEPEGDLQDSLDVSIPAHDSGDLLVAYIARTADEYTSDGTVTDVDVSPDGPDGWKKIEERYRDTGDGGSPIQIGMWARIGDGDDSDQTWSNADDKDCTWIASVHRVVGAAYHVDDAIVQSEANSGHNDEFHFNALDISNARTLILMAGLHDNDGSDLAHVEDSSEFEGSVRTFQEYAGQSSDDNNGMSLIVASDFGPPGGGDVDRQRWDIRSTEEWATITAVIAPPSAGPVELPTRPTVHATLVTTAGPPEGSQESELAVKIPVHTGGDLLVAFISRTADEYAADGDYTDLEVDTDGPDGWTKILADYRAESGGSPVQMEVWATIGSGSTEAQTWENSDGLDCSWIASVHHIVGAAATVDDAIVFTDEFNDADDRLHFSSFDIAENRTLVLYAGTHGDDDGDQANIEDSVDFVDATVVSFTQYTGQSSDGNDGMTAVVGYVLGPDTGGEVERQRWDIGNNDEEEYVTFTVAIAPPADDEGIIRHGELARFTIFRALFRDDLQRQATED